MALPLLMQNMQTLNVQVSPVPVDPFAVRLNVQVSPVPVDPFAVRDRLVSR